MRSPGLAPTVPVCVGCRSLAACRSLTGAPPSSTVVTVGVSPMRTPRPSNSTGVAQRRVAPDVPPGSDRSPSLFAGKPSKACGRQGTRPWGRV